MLWPFSRFAKDAAESADLRRQLRHTRAVLHEARQRAASAEMLADTLRDHLDRSERERTAVNLKLVRVGFGINPFAEEMQQTSVLPSEAEPSQVTSLGMEPSPDEVRATLVREAVEMFGNDLRKISRYVEKQQAEYYAHRNAPPSIVSDEEMAAAARVAADLEAALEEGAQEAMKG